MITVLKLDAQGVEQLRYSAELLQQTPTSCSVRATFVFPTKITEYTSFATGDCLNEHFYTDRWYNVFALYEGDSDRLKGWYCNICRPARFEDDMIHCEDLALDVWVSPLGEVLVLDEDEFAELGLDSAETAACQNAVTTIKQLAARQQLPR